MAKKSGFISVYIWKSWVDNESRCKRMLIRIGIQSRKTFYISIMIHLKLNIVWWKACFWIDLIPASNFEYIKISRAWEHNIIKWSLSSTTQATRTPPPGPTSPKSFMIFNWRSSRSHWWTNCQQRQSQCHIRSRLEEWLDPMVRV